LLAIQNHRFIELITCVVADAAAGAFFLRLELLFAYKIRSSMLSFLPQSAYAFPRKTASFPTQERREFLLGWT